MNLREAQAEVMRARAALHFEQGRVAKATRSMLDATAGEAKAEIDLEHAERNLDALRREAKRAVRAVNVAQLRRALEASS